MVERLGSNNYAALEAMPTAEVYFSFANIVRYVTCGGKKYVVGIKNKDKKGRYQALGGAAKIDECGRKKIDALLTKNAARITDLRKGEKSNDVRFDAQIEAESGQFIVRMVQKLSRAWSGQTAENVVNKKIASISKGLMHLVADESGGLIEGTIDRELIEELQKKGILSKEQCEGLKSKHVTTLSQRLPPPAAEDAKDSKRKIRIFRQFDLEVDEALLQVLIEKSKGGDSPLVLIPLESSELQDGINTVKEGIVTVTLDGREIQLADNIIPELVKKVKPSPDAVESH
jgi:hypothetical protein